MENGSLKLFTILDATLKHLKKMIKIINVSC